MVQMTCTTHCSEGAGQSKLVVVRAIMLARAELAFRACHRGTERLGVVGAAMPGSVSGEGGGNGEVGTRAARICERVFRQNTEVERGGAMATGRGSVTAMAGLRATSDGDADEKTPLFRVGMVETHTWPPVRFRRVANGGGDDQWMTSANEGINES